MLYGYVLEWDGFEAGSADSNRSLFEESILRVPTLEKGNDRRYLPSKRWSFFSLRSNRPLLGEFESENQSKIEGSETRFYPVYFRVNERTKTVIFAAQRYSITDVAVSTFNAFITPNLRRRVIDIEALSSRLLTDDEDKKFCVTYFMADVPGYGSALNTISLHGDDLGAADFLSEERTNFTARQIGVRTISNRSEAGRFSNTGSIQFRLEAIPELEKFLSYTYQEKLYVD